ncbi:MULTISPECIES: MFS transporter [unclassified Streptomyces]|uniref:MFS transporter n=1 Tax=unclassified Streptomyces TaxID=2593676 RepID=UPI0035DE1861
MPSREKRTFDDLLDAQPLGRLQIGVIVMCALVAVVDGLDTQAIALAAPDIASDWGTGSADFGLVFGIGLFGGLVGAIVFGRTSDRFGRRPNLLIAVAVFALFSLATPLVDSLTGLAVLRFLTGIGLGGALPGVISLTSEYTPRRMRATVVGLMFCGFPLGAVIGGAVSAAMIPALGWQSVFVLGGVVPLLFLPVFWVLLPESARFLTLTGDHQRLGKILRRMRSSVTAEQIIPEPSPTRSPVVRLFTDGRAAGTLLLWATLFMSLLLTYLLINWIPLVARDTGIGSSGAALAVAALNLGAIVGQLVIGRLADRSSPTRVTGTAFALGAVAIAAIGLSGQSGAALLVTAFVAGFLSIGAQMCTVALCAIFYETSLRATGVGWAMGIGRIGGIVGPVLGGVAVAAGASVPTLFLLTGAASLCAGAAAFAMARATSSGERVPSKAVVEMAPAE